MIEKVGGGRCEMSVHEDGGLGFEDARRAFVRSPLFFVVDKAIQQPITCVFFVLCRRIRAAGASSPPVNKWSSPEW